MHKHAVVFTFLTVAAISSGAHAADDEAQCKRIVNTYLLGETSLSPNSPQVDNSQRKANSVKQMRADRIPECDIQRSLTGTAAQVEDRRPTQR
jgi:hypothetical protein